MIGTKIHVTGIVQGVGFRPFVYNLAQEKGLKGWVCNTSAGVDIELSGNPQNIEHFVQILKSDPPPLARIDSIEFHQIPFQLYDKFEIIESKVISEAFQPISPDICICEDCLREMLDPTNRRFLYPFINCTNCGPRLTIINDIPYDRPLTTMKDFKMCPDCESEYSNPSDRRFHAQPIACPVCGPHVWLEYPQGKDGKQQSVIGQHDGAILRIQTLIKKGQIIAIKGLGGFHLACDATNPKAVAELRKRKLRVGKPFALMFPNMSSIEANCVLTDSDRLLIQSRERPIVIVPRNENSTIAEDVSPKQHTLGVMLPYTPLHYLLFTSISKKKTNIGGQREFAVPPLVMTSGNLSEEPIAINNLEARLQLSGIADAFLMHDRTIRTRCDDSVIRSFRSATIPLRRSRGYAPYPVYLRHSAPQILAVGGELKNTFCITRDHYAFLSHHIGDMENSETYESFVDSVKHYESLFRVQPEAIAYDLHPNYLATRYAQERSKSEGLPAYGVQHHHAHIAACMTDNSIGQDRSVIGVALDGTGYGEDGAIWGGEFLLSDLQNYKRVCHLKYVPLPGGDAAIRKPARTALAYLWTYKIDWEPDFHSVAALCAEERSIIKSMLIKKINTPLTSSMGRLFDAVASIAGICHQVNYEAQAAIELEALLDANETGEYELALEKSEISKDIPYQINVRPMIEEILHDVSIGLDARKISAKFHNSIAKMVSYVCIRIRADFDVNDVVLSGGVWQNITLLNHVYHQLLANQFKVYIHKQVPTNDGGLALGQAAVAICHMDTAK